MKTNFEKLFSSRIINYKVNTIKKWLVKYVNLDNAATTMPFKSVERDLSWYIKTYWSVHRWSWTKSILSTNLYEESREIIKKFVKANESDYVILTGNTTWAMNTAAHFFSFLKWQVAVSEIEHSSSWLPWIKAEWERQLWDNYFDLDEMNYQNQKIQINWRKKVLQYKINEFWEFDISKIEDLLQNNNIKVLVLTASSNLTWYIPNIKKIGEIVHKYWAYFMVDACQYIQHSPINMKDMWIDFLAASWHKFYAPYWWWFLIWPKIFLDQFLPYQIWWWNLPYITNEWEFIRYNNQLAHDPWTPNAIWAITMASALKQINKIGFNNIEKYEKCLAEKLYDYMQNNPKIDLYVNKNHLSTVIPFNIKDKKWSEIAKILNDDYGIWVRCWSFCTYYFVKKLLWIKDEKKIIEEINRWNTSFIPTIIRISLNISNTEEDIKRVIDALEQITL